MSRIAELIKANAKYNIFTSIRNVEAVPKNGPLSGLSTALKDNIVTTEEPTTCSSLMLKEYRSPFPATVATLLQENGAAMVGKTNLDEFGMGSATIHSVFGPTLNPLFPNEARVCGGSSGGSAAAVAADVVDFSIGTDTGGSVRLPAAYTGIFGFKPSYGRISRWGVVLYSQSLDTVGILSKNIQTIGRVFEALDKHDQKDPTSLTVEQRLQLDNHPKSSDKLRVGIVQEFNLQETSAKVNLAMADLLEKCEKLGFEVVNLSMPVMKAALASYYTLAPAEASSNLARYDGIRYGHLSESPVQARTEGFGPEVQRRILMGTYNLSSESYNNHFLKAQLVRERICEEFNNVFKVSNILSAKSTGGNLQGVDFILSPTLMTEAPTLDSFKANEQLNPVNSYVNDVFTVPASLAKLPSINIPWTAHGDEIPLGLQLMGQFGDDNRLLKMVERLQSTA